MPFKITITDDADRQVRSLPVREQRILEAAIQSRLEHEPTKPTKAIKRLRPNPWLMRGILIVGRKVGNKLIVEGEEFYGHQDNPIDPPGNGSPKDAE